MSSRELAIRKCSRIVGRLRNNNYDKDGETVYALAFTVEEIDYLDSKADSVARRERPKSSAVAAAAAGAAAPAQGQGRAKKG